MAAIKLLPDSKNFNLQKKDIGKPDSLRYNVMVFVAEENYDRAIHEIKKYMDQEFEYPGFKEKIERYMSYSIDLVNAIRAKRKFPGMSSLTTAKQQEIIEKFHYHYEELRLVLKKVEKVHHTLEVEDHRSTIIVVRAVVNAAIAIAILAFVLESSRGMVANVYTVSDNYLANLIDFVFQRFGL